MCGILCYVSASKPCSEPLPGLIESLKARGPDSYGCVTAELSSTCESLSLLSEGDQNAVYVRCHASVLSLRGRGTTAQPLQGETSHIGSSEDKTHSARPILCWNGEIFGYGNESLRSSSSPCQPDSGRYYSSTTSSEHAPSDVATATNHTVSACTLAIEQSDSAWLYERLCDAATTDQRTEMDLPAERKVAKGSSVNGVLDNIRGPFAFVFVDTLNNRLYYGRDRLGRRSLLLKRSHDCEVCFASVSDGTPGWTEVAPQGRYLIDLGSSRAFRDHLVHEQQDALGLAESIHQYRYEPLQFNRNVPIMPLVPMSSSSAAVSTLQSLLADALEVRLKSLPGSSNPQQARFAVLFSGGLDCTTLARMIHDILPTNEPIDLLNVAFENPRISGGLTAEESYSLCPDRVTALASHAELKAVCLGRDWRLVAINVPYAETLAHRPMIKRLMHPHDTEMDLSIASALYFASRGEGSLDSATRPPASSPTSSTPRPDTTTASPTPKYRTPARVLISGLGADELFAGYQRHATAFSRGGHAALLAELELDHTRLGTRNLGRDDRVLSHWGRECRFPFLDERVVQWAVAADVADKCGFGAGPTSHAESREPDKKAEQGEALQQTEDIEPGKKVLRLLADRLGMRGVAREKKRAIQFGARSAKMESGRSRGTDVL